MIHTLRPAKERLQRNLSLHAGTTLRRALFNAFNEQPSVLPVLEEDKPTNGEFIAMIADKLSMERSA